MKRKVYFTYLYYMIGGTVGLLMPLLLSIITGYAIVVSPENPTIQYAYIALFIGIIGFILFLNIWGKKMIQWIIIDETYITAKCLFGVIKKVKWDDLKDIIFEKFDIGSPGIKSGWFVFVEAGKKLYQRNGVITKDSYITLKSNRKTLETIKCYWNKKIINLID